MTTLQEANTLSVGKKMSISALIISSNPEGRKFKECIGDGNSPKEDSGFTQTEETKQEEDEERDEEMRSMQERFSMADFRDKLRVAEALAQASDMTSPAAKRRLGARKMEMDMAMTTDQGRPVFLNDEDVEYTPPKELLIYIMR